MPPRKKPPTRLIDVEAAQAELTSCFVDEIAVGERMRKPTEEAVEAMMASIKEIGMRTPISVRRVGPVMIDGEEWESAYALVTGATRLEAMRRLDSRFIDCFVLTCDDIDAALWEIDENLSRTGLTKKELREHMRRRKELWEQRQVELGGTTCPTQLDSRGQKKTAQQTKSFAAETAAATGLSKRQINRLLADDPAPRPQQEPQPEAQRVEDDGSRADCERLLVAWRSARQPGRDLFLKHIGADHHDDRSA